MHNVTKLNTVLQNFGEFFRQNEIVDITTLVEWKMVKGHMIDQDSINYMSLSQGPRMTA